MALHPPCRLDLETLIELGHLFLTEKGARFGLLVNSAQAQFRSQAPLEPATVASPSIPHRPTERKKIPCNGLCLPPGRPLVSGPSVKGGHFVFEFDRTDHVFMC